MKAFKKIIILVALTISVVLFVSAVALAANPTVTIEKTADAKKVSVVIEKLSAPATVWVVNEEGIVLLEEKSVGTKFAKIFNLEYLPTGAYKVIITTDRKEIVQPLTLNAAELALNVSAREEFYAPFFNVKNDVIDLSLLNNRLTDINVAIVNAEGYTVYEENFDNVLKVEKRYRLADLGKGNYTVQVTTPHKSYYQAVAVK